jgi:hypothetical protein
MGAHTMTPLLQHSSGHASTLSLSRPWRFLDLLHSASQRLLTLTAIAVAISWVPPALLSALRGGTVFLSYLTDYASQSRFLIIVPLLMLASPDVHRRVTRVEQYLEQFVQESQLSTFKASWASFNRVGNSTIVKVSILLLTYAFAIWMGRNLSSEGVEIVDWWRGSGGFRWFSPAGTWALFVSYPILLFLTLLWLWRQLLWTRFMWATARLDLRLVAAHPDGLGGIGFVESALRGQQAFSFCLGATLAGAVANRMFHHGQKLTSFADVAAVLVAAVLLICVAPYFAFTPALLHMRREGLLKYGGFARAAGEQFEQKWLNRPEGLNQDVLMVVDFSAMQDLYGVVSNVNKVSALPVSRLDLYGLFAAAFVPAIPVVIGSVPFDVVARAAMKMLL